MTGGSKPTSRREPNVRDVRTPKKNQLPGWQAQEEQTAHTRRSLHAQKPTMRTGATGNAGSDGPPVQPTLKDNNCSATNRFRGTTYEHKKGTWRSRIYHKGRHITLGRYKTGEQAARAHDAAASFVFGPGAATNFRLLRAASDAPEGLPFGITVRKNLLALRREMARPYSYHQDHDARSLRARAAHVAFAMGPRTARSHSAMRRRVWLDCAFKAAIATAARLAI